MKIWKLLGAIVIISTFVIFSPYGLAWLNLIQPIKDHAWYITAVATVGMVIKILCGDLISGEFLYYKHGYDSCILTFGAALSSLSLQLLSKNDEFPNISSTGLLGIHMPGSNVVDQKKFLLFIIFALALLGTFLTAYIARAISHSDTRAKGVLSIINFSIGSALLGTYLLMLFAKEHS